MEQVCAEQGVPCVLSEVFAKGGEGGKALAEAVLSVMRGPPPSSYAYPLEMPLKDKVKAIATKIYRGRRGQLQRPAASKTLAELTEMGYGNLPVCIAKTQYSFSDNAKLLARSRRALPWRCVRSAWFCRRGLCGGHLRQYHDHARPAQEACCRQH